MAGDEDEDVDEAGGEPACLAARLCPECQGVITYSHGHRVECSRRDETFRSDGAP